MAPRVSAIVRSHNYGRYIGQAIDSLLEQRVPLEVLVIDDRSTDDTREVLSRYAREPRVRVILHDRNAGNIATANEGFALASADVVTLVDADDFCVAADAMARQLEIFDADERVGMVYTAQLYVDAAGRAFRTFVPWGSDYVRDGLVEFADLAFRNYVSVSGTLVRREVLLAAGGFDADLPHAADWALWLRVAARSRVGYLAEPLYAYRVHGENMSVARHSPRRANGEIVRAVARGFDALPASAPDELRRLRPIALRHVLLATHWGDRGLGRTRRAWLGLFDAALRAPALLRERSFYLAFARTLVLTVLGRARYQRLASWRKARPMGGTASASFATKRG
ncbi:MAG TPA: glycosyltransferase [Candidatus Acidoferrales bacterium]|nr:glycosyltransferase [Candidatus Acidoferrales bacterium]